MARDRFDILTVVGVLISVLVIAGLLLTASGQKSSASAVDKALEQQIAYQARVDFLRKLYKPVEDLRQQGAESSALLKLDEIARRYPQEAHGEVLRGEILLNKGAVRQAVDHYVRAVRLNGDYVEKNNPLTRRKDIDQLVKKYLTQFSTKARKDPGNLQLQNTLTGLYYLQSRLAGGCE